MFFHFLQVTIAPLGCGIWIIKPVFKKLLPTGKNLMNQYLMSPFILPSHTSPVLDLMLLPRFLCDFSHRSAAPISFLFYYFLMWFSCEHWNNKKHGKRKNNSPILHCDFYSNILIYYTSSESSKCMAISFWFGIAERSRGLDLQWLSRRIISKQSSKYVKNVHTGWRELHCERWRKSSCTVYRR